MTTARADAVLLLDGVFLQRPELIDRWDLRIFVSATFEEMLDRGRIRDLARLGSTAAVERRFRDRYIPAQELYFARPVQPITPTSSCTTMTPSSPPGKYASDIAGQHEHRQDGHRNGQVSCRCMRASDLLPIPPSPATLLAGWGFHRRRARRHQVPGTAPAIGLHRPCSSETSDAVPLPGGARSGRAGRPCPRADRPPRRLPRPTRQPAQCRPFIAAPEPEVKHDAGPQPQRLQGTE